MIAWPDQSEQPDHVDIPTYVCAKLLGVASWHWSCGNMHRQADTIVRICRTMLFHPRGKNIPYHY